MKMIAYPLNIIKKPSHLFTLIDNLLEMINLIDF